VPHAHQDKERRHQSYNKLYELHITGVSSFYILLIVASSIFLVLRVALTAARMQENSQLSKPLPQNNTVQGDPADAFMAVDPHVGLLPTDMPDSARGSFGSAGPGGFPQDPTPSVNGIQPGMSGDMKPQEHFGSGLMMPPVDNDPLYLGPIKPDYIFPLPSSVEDAVQLAWTASYRFA
jgi:hypothetical protein